MQEDEIERISKKILKRVTEDYDLGEKILFLNKIHSSKGSVSVRISKLAFDLAKKFCEENEISINAYVTSAVAQRLFDDVKKDLNDKDKDQMDLDI